MATVSPSAGQPRTNLAPVILVGVAILSAAVLGYEVALMRLLSLTGWTPYTALVISTALLGFGASGSLLAVWSGRLRRTALGVLQVLMVASGVAMVPAAAAAGWLPFNELEFLSNPGQWGWLLAKQLVLFVPFLLAGGAIGWALSAWAAQTSVIYGANMIGSGLGAAAAVLAMYVLAPGGVIWSCGLAAMAAGLLSCLQRSAGAGIAVRVGIAFLAGVAGVVLCLTVLPLEPRVSVHKGLRQALNTGAEVMARYPSPLGRIDIVDGEALRQVPGMSLSYAGPEPRQRLLFVDAEGASPIPRIASTDDWSCFEATTAALAHRIAGDGRVLIMGLGNLWQAGLALRHHASSVTVCEPNQRMIQAVRGLGGPWSDWLFHDPRVRLVAADPRGFLQAARGRFDLIVFPLVAASAVGSLQRDYLLTIEGFQTALGRLRAGGIVAVTAGTSTPPRAEIRLFATAVAALRRSGRAAPEQHLIWVRHMETSTLLMSPRPFGRSVVEAARAFCDERCFDAAWLPDIRADEVNRWFQLDRPYYYQAAAALLSEESGDYLDRYVFSVGPQTIDRPFFHDFFKWSGLRSVLEQTQGRWQAFVDIGYPLALAGVVQAAILAAVLILLPLRWLGASGRGGARAWTLLYFGLLGVGYMAVEMCMIARLQWFLADPVLAASVVLGGFLAISGLGSLLSRRISPRFAMLPAACVAVLAAVFAFGLIPLLSPMRGWDLSARLAMSVVTMAPLALVMGMPFPLGLARIGSGRVGLRAWAWGINGFLSVIAAAGVQVVAATTGDRAPMLAAGGAYALAALLIGLRRIAAGPAAT